MDRNASRRLVESVRWVEKERRSSTRRVREPSRSGSTVRVYKAIADESAGTIQVKQVNSDGSTTGDTVTLEVLP